ncbi:MAG: hypothetical protein U5R14_14380 [Gemmatimonadota bacterium]|nr:hypothetical protein [Gemmatimonadota bacterium]
MPKPPKVGTRAAVGTVLVLGALALGGCGDLLGTRLERDVRIEVDPTVEEEHITAVIRNEGSADVMVHHDCMKRLRPVVDGVLQPPEHVICAAVLIPPTPIPPGDALEWELSIRGVEPGTYRAWFTLTDVGGELPEAMRLSDPFTLQ